MGTLYENTLDGYYHVAQVSAAEQLASLHDLTTILFNPVRQAQIENNIKSMALAIVSVSKVKN